MLKDLLGHEALGLEPLTRRLRNLWQSPCFWVVNMSSDCAHKLLNSPIIHGMKLIRLLNADIYTNNPNPGN